MCFSVNKRKFINIKEYNEDTQLDSHSLDIAFAAFSSLFSQVYVFCMFEIILYIRFSIPVNISFLSFCLRLRVSYVT